MTTNAGDEWVIPCLDWAGRPRSLRLVLTRPAGIGLIVPAGDAAILVPDQIGHLISSAQAARTLLLHGGIRP